MAGVCKNAAHTKEEGQSREGRTMKRCMVRDASASSEESSAECLLQ